MNYTMTKNAEFNSLEITFDGKPAQAIRDALKALRFRWHNVRRVWYGYADEATTRAALDGANGSGTAPAGEDQNSKQRKKPARVLASLWDRCDVSALPAYGTENTIEEVRESIAERREECNESRTDAVITRKINFTDSRIFENFCTMFLRDFDFLAGKGGTASDDVRLSEDIDPYRLNDRQRESIKFYLCDCIGVYLCDSFQFVIDPQGYEYARYILIPDDGTDSYRAEEKRQEWREKSEQMPALHFPAPVSEQITAANLQPGEDFTMIHLDPWIMTATTTAGTVNGWSVTDYAQYRNVARLNYTTIGKRKPESVHIKDGATCAIWRGILPDVPDTIKYSDCGGGLQQVNYSGESATDYVINAIRYYQSIGFSPVVDTIQR